MEVIEFGQLSESQRTELEGDEVDPFDAAGNTLEWRKKERHVALRRPDGRLVASTGMVLAEVQVEDSELIPIVGIGGVFVAAQFRGRGLANEIISAALARAATLGPDLAMLFCHRNRAGLYLKHDFAEVPPPVLVEQPSGLAEIEQVTMWRPLRAGVELPQGHLTVRSLPF